MKPTITNLQGEKKVLSGFANMKRTKRVNGEKELSFTLYRTRANDHYFDAIGELWTVGFLGDEYKVLLTSDDADGNDYQREFSCVHTFYDTLRNIPVEEERSKTMSFNECLSFILADSPFQFNIQGEFPSKEFENFGVSDACDLFLEAMERYGAEFTVEGPIITLVPEIGRDTDFQYRYKFNVNSVNREIDAVDLATVGIGLGKVDEDTGERLARVEYRSPLADVYGEGRKVIVEDKRFTIEANLLEKVKEEVDNSLKTSITFKFHDLRDQGYDRARPEEGDRVFLVDGRMGLKLRTRMVEIVEMFNAHLDVVDCDVTLSNFDNVENQQRRQEKTIKAISDAIEGKKPMKLEWLSDVVQFTTDKLQSFETEFTILSNGSVLAVDTNDPNNVMLYTAGGVGISTDGGNTYDNALTAQGLNATAIWTGTIRTGSVRIEGSRGLFYIDDERATWKDADDPDNNYTIIEPGRTEIKGTGFVARRPDDYPLIFNGQFNMAYNVVWTPTPWIEQDVEQVGFDLATDVTSFRDIANGRFRHDSRYLYVTIGQRVENDGETCTVQIERSGEPREVWATSTETTTSDDWREVERVISIDLGVPTGERIIFYVRMKSSDGTRVRARVLDAYLMG